jgi:hypothetical protein
MECLVFAGCLLAIVGIIKIISRMIDQYRRPRRLTRNPARVVCVHCHGSGWIERRERTLEFTGSGFADIQHPATMCEACGGSGQTLRQP